MKTLIKIDPDPSAWGSECTEDVAARANSRLIELLRADGYDAELNASAETRIAAETDDEREDARRAIERHFKAALAAALAEAVKV